MEEKRYGAKPERCSWTLEADDGQTAQEIVNGQTAQEIVNGDTWGTDDLVHQLARDLIDARMKLARAKDLAHSWRREFHEGAHGMLFVCADELEVLLDDA